MLVGTTRWRHRLPWLLIAALLALAGCSEADTEPEPTWSTAGADVAGATEVVTKRQLEEAVLERLDDDYRMLCDGGLYDVVGSTQVCHASYIDTAASVLVEVTEVDGEKVDWVWEPFLSVSDIAATLPDDLRAGGAAVTEIDCPGPLRGKVGAEMTCPTQGSVSQVWLRVAAVDGLQIDVEFEAR